MNPSGAALPSGHTVDLHVHTAPLSSDSALLPDDLARRSIELGLDGICVTEHNAIWTVADGAELAERRGIPVLRGMEVATDAGHVLVFGVEGFSPEMFSLDRLRRIVESEGGAMVLAHPMRSQAFRRPWSEAPHLFEALEALNGDENGAAATLVSGIARSVGMAVTGGSDAHSLRALGRCATRFADSIADERSLVAALRNGRFEAINLAETHAG